MPKVLDNRRVGGRVVPAAMWVRGKTKIYELALVFHRPTEICKGEPKNQLRMKVYFVLDVNINSVG